MRKLAIIAICGFGVAVVSVGAVAAIGAHGAHDFDMRGFNFPFFDSPSCGRTDDGSSATSRTLAWDGSDRAVLDIPAHASWAPGNDAMLHISGDPTLIAHIRIEDGHIKLNCHGWNVDGGDMQIVLPGRTFDRFAIAGSGRMNLDGLDQKRLKIAIAGSGNIHANGHVKQLDVHIAGSGDADLGDISANDVEVHIAGSGNADIAPHEKADIHIAGSGDVILHSHPAQMDTRIAGSGRIRTAENGI